MKPCPRVATLSAAGLTINVQHGACLCRLARLQRRQQRAAQLRRKMLLATAAAKCLPKWRATWPPTLQSVTKQQTTLQRCRGGRRQGLACVPRRRQLSAGSWTPRRIDAPSLALRTTLILAACRGCQT